MKENATIQHESFGLMEVSRVHYGKGHAMCGTDMQPENLIQFTIYKNCEQTINEHTGRRVSRSRGSWSDRVSVEMTFSQFSTMICSMNMGDGTPCNVLYWGKDGEIERYTEPVVGEFESKYNDIISELKSQTKKYEDAISEIKKSIDKLSKTKQEEIIGIIRGLERSITDKIPFYAEQLNEYKEDIVNRAKSEIAHYVDVAAYATGIKQLGQQQTGTEPKLLTTEFDDITPIEPN